MQRAIRTVRRSMFGPLLTVIGSLPARMPDGPIDGLLILWRQQVVGVNLEVRIQEV